jgi:hypothetical protein
MAERAGLPAEGPTAWQFREKRRRLFAEILVGLEDHARFRDAAKLAQLLRKRPTRDADEDCLGV